MYYALNTLIFESREQCILAGMLSQLMDFEQILSFQMMHWFNVDFSGKERLSEMKILGNTHLIALVHNFLEMCQKEVYSRVFWPEKIDH